MDPSSHPAPKKQRHLLGIMLLICAVTGFAGMDASAKWLGKSVNPLQIATFRYAFSFIITTFLLFPWKRPQILRAKKPVLQCVRSACLVVATLSVFTALRYVPLTEATAICFSAPLLVSLLAGYFLGEKIGPRRALAVVIGFIGVLIVTRPGGTTMHIAALLAFVAAVANAFYSITTRLLAGHDQAETTMFYTGLVGTLVLLPVVPFVWETPTTPDVWGMLIFLGTLGALAHWLLILALRNAPASMLAPFYYTQLIGASVIGAVVFDEIPDRWTILGGSIVIGSGLYVFYREQFRRREATAVPPPGDGLVK